MNTVTIRRVARGIIKRTLDCVAAFVGLLVLSPLFVVLGILIKLDTRGPVFYRGPRIGRHGVYFRMLKFRTMYENEKSYRGPRVTAKEDDRITPFGRWLRDTKLNELPQLWNVLVGDMSLVGPRPEDPAISKTWPLDVALEILSVRPGITSPASIVYRDEERMLQAGEVMRKYLHELVPDKMRLDQLYVEYQSFWLDLDVIAWTFFLLMPRIRAYNPSEPLLFVGPITRVIQRYINWFGWDFLVIFLSITLSSTIGRLFGPLDIGVINMLALALGYSALFSFVGILFNTNSIKWPKATASEWISLALTWFIVTGVTLTLIAVLKFMNVRVFGVVVASSFLSLGGFLLGRYRERMASGLKIRLATQQTQPVGGGQRVLIVGSGRTAEHLAWLMDHPTYAAKFHIVGFIDDNLLLNGMKIYGSRIIGQVKDIQKIVKLSGVNLIILADSQMTTQKRDELVEIAKAGPAHVVVAPDLFGGLAGLDGTGSQLAGLDNLSGFQWLVPPSERAEQPQPAASVAAK